MRSLILTQDTPGECVLIQMLSGTCPNSVSNDCDSGGEVCDEVEVVGWLMKGRTQGIGIANAQGWQGQVGLRQEKTTESVPIRRKLRLEFWRFWLCRRSGEQRDAGSWYAGVQGGGAVAQEAQKILRQTPAVVPCICGRTYSRILYSAHNYAPAILRGPAAPSCNLGVALSAYFPQIQTCPKFNHRGKEIISVSAALAPTLPLACTPPSPHQFGRIGRVRSHFQEFPSSSVI